MSWDAYKRDTVTPADLYKLAQEHKLVIRDMESAIHNYRSMAPNVSWWDVLDGEDVVAVCLIMPLATGIAQLDFIPSPEHFAPSCQFADNLCAALSGVIADVFGGQHQIRKIESEVPASRRRTKQALAALGFEHEGKRKVGIQFYGCDPEDTFMLGLLPEKLRRA